MGMGRRGRGEHRRSQNQTGRTRLGSRASEAGEQR